MGAEQRNIDGLHAFGLTALVEHGALRRLTFRGCEVVRLIDYPIRDADWTTLPTVTESEHLSPDAFARHFRSADGAIEGRFEASVTGDDDSARIEAAVSLSATRRTVVNRAGFIVLHPLDGVVGEPVTVQHADGRAEDLTFPTRISPGQPVMDIASLEHRIGDVEVSLAFDGEVFEMEDQRNWTDASFKTYCRPLAAPRPYDLRPGEEVRQRISVTVTRTVAPVPVAGACGQGGDVTMPEVCVAHEGEVVGIPHPHLASVAPQGVLLRARAGEALPDVLPALPVTLELVVGADAAADLRAARAAALGAHLKVTRAIALPSAYLKSHQPEGPWPEGPAPMDLLPMVRASFPGAQVGGGVLTNFTEFNRCRPDPESIDFATFGTTAIVHAADDRSVLETLEAIPQVIASARALSGDRPLRLGLMSIGMRSNPYGAGVVANPDGLRIPMAKDDPRQRTSFAAAFAIAVAAACARGGVSSFAPAMTGGSLGMADAEGPWPLWHAVAALAAMSGATVTVEGGPASGLLTIRGPGRRGIGGIAANLGPADAHLEAPAILIPDRAPADWIDTPGVAGPLTLVPMTAAILTRGRT